MTQSADAGLVTSSGSSLATSWSVHSRNDPPQQVETIPDWGGGYVVEIDHREYLRTINGRPSEYSTTRSRSISRSAGTR